MGIALANHTRRKSWMAMNIFEAKGLSELAAGCKWFVDWFQVADNPALTYKEVSCPEELSGKGVPRHGGNGCL
jgi:hypothetical protein